MILKWLDTERIDANSAFMSERSPVNSVLMGNSMT